MGTHFVGQVLRTAIQNHRDLALHVQTGVIVEAVIRRFNPVPNKYQAAAGGGIFADRRWRGEKIRAQLKGDIAIATVQHQGGLVGTLLWPARLTKRYRLEIIVTGDGAETQTGKARRHIIRRLLVSGAASLATGESIAGEIFHIRTHRGHVGRGYGRRLLQRAAGADQARADNGGEQCDYRVSFHSCRAGNGRLGGGHAELIVILGNRASLSRSSAPLRRMADRIGISVS